MRIEDLIAPLAGLLGLVAALLVGMNHDRRDSKRRALDISEVLDRADRRAAKLERVKTDITREADEARSNPEPTEAEVEAQREKIKALWRKLKIRGRM